MSRRADLKEASDLIDRLRRIERLKRRYPWRSGRALRFIEEEDMLREKLRRTMERLGL